MQSFQIKVNFLNFTTNFAYAKYFFCSPFDAILHDIVQYDGCVGLQFEKMNGCEFVKS